MVTLDQFLLLPSILINLDQFNSVLIGGMLHFFHVSLLIMCASSFVNLILHYDERYKYKYKQREFHHLGPFYVWFLICFRHRGKSIV